MNQQKLIPIALILLMPFHVLAHGEEILYPIFGQFITLIFFLIFIFALRIETNEKFNWVAIYIFSILTVLCLSWVFPYLKNEEIINKIWIFGPAMITFIIFLIERQKRK
jgi:FtsH-binding integral membrane protein